MSNRPSILVVEDAAEIRLLLKMVLSGLADIIEAENAAAAERALEKIQPSLIITDLMIPDFNGIAFVSRLLTLTRKEVPLLVLSGDCFQLEEVKLQFPDVVCMSKPFIPSDLRTRIKTMLDQQLQLQRN
jgi:DNA-binding response OmpR family regulator